MYDIIKKKRDGFSLTKEEIEYFVHSYEKGYIPDYQVSALLMAIYFNGMNEKESSYLTNAMAKSGDLIDLSKVEGTTVDKHSTGGVGDSVTLVLVPLIASVNVPIAKISGRGLGHTGGTLDKLESIPNFSIRLENDQFISLVNKNSAAIMGQTANLTPADDLIYRLRDVTATVESIPLIASSIMSKKIATGSDVIVLDVKVGSGAFMKTYEEAEKLAKLMVSIGKNLNKKTIAILSQMDEPLGYAVGNALEIKEVIETLKGNGPQDLLEVCLELGSEMILQTNRVKTKEEAKLLLQKQIDNKQALKKFAKLIEAQNGNANIIEHDYLLPKAEHELVFKAEKNGYIASIDSTKIGETAMYLGAGRKTKDDQIDLSVGLILHKKIGDFVKKGDPLVTVHTNFTNNDTIFEKLKESFSYSSKKVGKSNLILGVIK